MAEHEIATEPTLDLRNLTPARVSLLRTGSSLATQEILAFSQAHAQARDAVYTTLATPTLLEALHRRHLNPIQVHSAAPDRPTYIRRPDLGRTLNASSTDRLRALPPTPGRLTIILADGLSALAANRHAIPLLDALLPQLTRFQLTPIILAEQARVALADEIGQILQSQLTLILIGERPGLSSPESLGAYLTWNPYPGRTDADRNCISNIRHEGLDYATAAAKILDLCRQAQTLQLTGTALKEGPLQPVLPEPPPSAETEKKPSLPRSVPSSPGS